MSSANYKEPGPLGATPVSATNSGTSVMSGTSVGASVGDTDMMTPRSNSPKTKSTTSTTNTTNNTTNTTTTNAPGGSDRRKSTKSRNGCLTCKKKRLKCDETKPACLKCINKNIECGGYATRFKWRSFNDDNDESPASFSVYTPQQPPQRPQAPEKGPSPKNRRGSDSLRKHLELASLSVTGKSIKDIKRENDLIEEGINPVTYNKRLRESTSANNAQLFAKLGDSSLHMADTDSADGDDDPRARKIKRSMSVVEKSARRPTSMGRSFSTNAMSPQDLADVRSHYSRTSSTGLNSLVEAAIDEINTVRSPGSDFYRRPHDHAGHDMAIPSLSPTISDFLTPAAKSPDTMAQIAKTPKDKLYRPSPGYSGSQGQLQTGQNSLSSHPQPVTGQNGVLSNSNYLFNTLSPSLSALINSAFGNDDDLRHSNLFDESLKIDIPLSPLNLQNPGLHEMYDPSPAPTPHNTNSAPKQIDQKGHHSPAANSAANSGSSSPLTVSVERNPRYSIPNASMMLSAEQEQILGLYSQYTAEILSIKNGPNENPWRNLILPRALQYSCLFNSIASITLFHLSGNEAITVNRDNLRAKGYMYMKRCILELASGLSLTKDGSSKNETAQQIPADIAIAICLNLAVSETWDKHISTGIAHLKGAKTMIQSVLTLLKENQMEMHQKRRKLLSSPGATPQDTEEYGKLINSRREELKQKLVLVEDSEWDELLVGEAEEVTNEPQDHKPANTVFKVPRSTQFLFNMWIYFEVLAQMTSETDEKGIDLVASITTLLANAQNKKEKRNSRDNERSPEINSESSESTMANIDTFGGIHRGFNNLFDNFESISLETDQVDPLLGCAQSLFSIMGKVATLISKIRKSKKKEQKMSVRNSLSTITMATQLRQELLAWKPTITASMLEQSNAFQDPLNSDLSSCIATGEAYRFATLLYLHQAVPEIPSLSSHQLAEKIFILLASIPTSCPSYTVHIFPLLVSSCEAEAAEEREWCEERWKLLSTRLWIGNVDRAFEVVKEVWKRKDEYVRKKNTNSFNINDVFIPQGTDSEKLKSISTQLSGLMAAVNSDQGTVDDITGGIYSKLHWSSVMKEWGWEVLLG